jgi:hypothetical protein
VETVAPGDQVAFELLLGALVAEPDPRAVCVEVCERHLGDLEQQRPAGGEPGLHQVLDDLGLPVDHQALPGQLVQRDPVPPVLELEADPVVDESFSPHPLADPRLMKEVGDALLEDPGADPCLDVLAAPVLEHDGVDSLQVEQVRERQPRRAGPDDADLRTHQPSSSTRCAIANAEFAAGTPQ